MSAQMPGSLAIALLSNLAHASRPRTSEIVFLAIVAVTGFAKLIGGFIPLALAFLTVYERGGSSC
jgi:hypothetical protein